MKAIITVSLALLLTNALNAQDYSGLEKITMEDQSDFAKNEDLVIECSEYLLNSPATVLEKDENRMNAAKFIMRWMDGTPDFMFYLDEPIGSMTNDNKPLLGIYLAAMSKYVLEHKNKADDQGEVKYNTFLTFIKYCEDPANKVEQNDEIKDLIKAKENNTLIDYLNIDVDWLQI